MDREDRQRVLKFALIAGSFLIIAVGLGVALSGQAFGWAIVAFGGLDLATVPFVARRVVAAGRTADRDPTGPDGSEDPSAPGATTDPSYNPYARED